MAYVLLDPHKQRVGLISRVPTQHKNKVAKHSILISAGVEKFFGSSVLGGEHFVNSYWPLTQKIGALANEFQIPVIQNRELDAPTRYSAFAVRKDRDRYYAFLIHFACLVHGSRFPSHSFELISPDGDGSRPADSFQGFFTFDRANDLIGESLLVDRFAMSILLGKRFVCDGMEGRVFTPKRLLTGVMGRCWDAIKLQPSWGGIGIDLKKLASGQ